MIRKRPRGEITFSKATYDEAAAALKALDRAHDRAMAREITAAGGLGNWVLARAGLPLE